MRTYLNKSLSLLRALRCWLAAGMRAAEPNELADDSGDEAERWDAPFSSSLDDDELDAV